MARFQKSGGGKQGQLPRLPERRFGAVGGAFKDLLATGQAKKRASLKSGVKRRD